MVQRFSYDLEMKTREQNRNNKRTEIERFDWFIKQIQTHLAFGWLRWLNTVLAVCDYMSFAKSWQEKGCCSQAETWQVKNVLIKDFD